MGLSDGRKSFRIGLAVLIQYRSVTATQPPSHVAVAITLNAKASNLKLLSRAEYTCVLDSFIELPLVRDLKQKINKAYILRINFKEM